MLNGNSTINRVRDRTIRTKVLQVEKKYKELLEYIRVIQEHSSFAYIVKESTRDIIGDLNTGHLNEMESALEGLADAFAYISRSIDLYSKWGDIFAVLAMGFLALTAIQLRSEGQSRLLLAEAETEKVEQQNQRNQQAILTLLDELGNLADGDLTVNATVTEDITGAIADSFNYAVDATRRLVRAINETTDQVAGAASEASEMALDVATQSNDAAKLISDAAQSIYIMSDNIDDISRNSADLAEEAKRSVAIASKGKTGVNETIQGMESIRENIQDTSKRIKRLGESSQQIGEIINLINDIAEQTSILALNASIQAAMAGESGRGFAIVADEVQQLAERAGNSTRQIETIIKGIQTDTNEAIASMEQSTIGVVSGANLAKAAGEDLSEIEQVSLRLADLIFDISSSAQAHSSEQGVIAENMRSIQGTATKAAEEIGQTVQIINNLADLSSELKKSVAGFKLPS
jgi:twitching motility protein PilJ